MTDAPTTGCSLCMYVYVQGYGWVPKWNSNCDVHKKPSDLL